MSTPWASAASKLSSVLPGAMWSAPLWPTRLARRACGSGWALTAGIPGTRTSCGCRRPGRARGSASPQRGQGRPRAAVDAVAAGAPGRRRARLAACAAAPGARMREHLVVGDVRPSVATDRRAPPSSPRTSRCSRCRRSSAGRAARRRSAASGRPRAGAAGSASSSSSGARMSGPRPAMRWSKRARASVEQLEHGPVELRRRRASPRADHEPGAPRACAASARPARTCPTSPSSAGASAASGRPRSAGTGACRRASTPRTARPASRSGQRSRAARGCGVRIASGTCPSSSGRIRCAAWWMVSPSGMRCGNAPGQGTLRTHGGGPRPHRRRSERPAGRRRPLRRRPDGVQRGARVGRRRRAARPTPRRSRRSSPGATSAASRSSRAAAGPAGRAARCRSARASSWASSGWTRCARSTRCSGG